jgi:hypothetical protein
MSVSKRRKSLGRRSLGLAVVAITGLALAITGTASADLIDPGNGSQRVDNVAADIPTVDINNDVAPVAPEWVHDRIESGSSFAVSFVNNGPFDLGAGSLSPTYEVRISAPSAFGVVSIDDDHPAYECNVGVADNVCVIRLSERWVVGETKHFGGISGSPRIEVFPMSRGDTLTYSVTSAFPDRDGAGGTLIADF